MTRCCSQELGCSSQGHTKPVFPPECTWEIKYGREPEGKQFAVDSNLLNYRWPSSLLEVKLWRTTEWTLPILVLTGVMIVFRKTIPYLDQPKRGGTAQAPAITQVNAQPNEAWVAVNLKLPMGLQTTMYLSIARTTRDHKATCPVEKNRHDSKPAAPTQEQELLKTREAIDIHGSARVHLQG